MSSPRFWDLTLTDPSHMPSNVIFVRALVSCILVMIVCGCGSKVEEGFILTNDGDSKDVVSDCLVKILSSSGHLPGQYGKKDIVLIFRDAEHKPVLKKESTLWAAEIKPSIDWKQFPKVRVSLQSNGQENAYFVTIPIKPNGRKEKTD
jgi:hypothetical protein